MDSYVWQVKSSNAKKKPPVLSFVLERRHFATALKRKIIIGAERPLVNPKSRKIN
jgi:hypothetical protein